VARRMVVGGLDGGGAHFASGDCRSNP
jgi:hypothetical protein